MLLRTWRYLTLLLAALALTMTSAHVLELPQKLTLDLPFYTAVNGSLYRWFAIVGGAYTVGSVVAAGALALLVRHRPASFRWTAAGAALLALGFVSWLTLVQPVNLEVAAALRRAPATVPDVWRLLRDRWEYGHATGFMLQLLGFSALLVSVLVETPADGDRARR